MELHKKTALHFKFFLRKGGFTFCKIPEGTLNLFYHFVTPRNEIGKFFSSEQSL